MSIPIWFVMVVFSFLLTYLIHSTLIIGSKGNAKAGKRNHSRGT